MRKALCLSLFIVSGSLMAQIKSDRMWNGSRTVLEAQPTTLRLAPQYAPALRVLGLVLLNRGNTQRAVETFKQALVANPLNPETYFNLATAYFRAGKLGDALDMAGRALVLDEEEARYHALLGDVLERAAAVHGTPSSGADAQAAFEICHHFLSSSQPGLRSPAVWAAFQALGG